MPDILPFSYLVNLHDITDIIAISEQIFQRGNQILNKRRYIRALLME